MCDRLIHRGPDGYGSFVEDTVALGHRRLSIIDLAGGDQPIANEDGSLQVIFNGEIYNYLELRKELIGRGHIFRTHSDTEVLAAAAGPNPEITIVATDEVYRCAVVGHK